MRINYDALVLNIIHDADAIYNTGILQISLVINKRKCIHNMININNYVYTRYYSLENLSVVLSHIEKIIILI